MILADFFPILQNYFLRLTEKHCLNLATMKSEDHCLKAGGPEQRLGGVGRVEEDDRHVFSPLVVRHVRGKVDVSCAAEKL